MYKNIHAYNYNLKYYYLSIDYYFILYINNTYGIYKFIYKVK